MKKRFPVLLLLTAAFAAFTLGFFLGRNQSRAQAQISVSPALQTVPAQTAPPETLPDITQPAIVYPIDINTADADTLMALPEIGEVLAQRIIAYREANGPFPYPESLMLVQDIGEKRLEAILDLITVGG